MSMIMIMIMIMATMLIMMLTHITIAEYQSLNNNFHIWESRVRLPVKYQTLSNGPQLLQQHGLNMQ